MNLNEITRRLHEASDNEDELNFSRSTFKRDIHDIGYLYGVMIEFDFHTRRYYIASGDDKVSSVYDTRLYEFTFCLCRNLDRVTISGEMSYIGFRCFSGCHSLKAIEIPDSVDMICEYAFEDCWSLKSIRLPKSLKMISLGLFNRCYSLEEIELPDMVELVKQEIIGYCRMRRGLKLPQFGSPEESIINVMPSLMDIFKAFVLRECKSLKRIVVPEGSIERYKAITPERHHHLFVAK